MSVEEINQETELISTNLLNRKPDKSFLQKTTTRTKQLLHSNRNFVANLNSAKRSYLLGWIMFLVNIFVCIVFLFLPKISIYYWIYSTFLFAAIAFVVGFTIDLYWFWKHKSKLLKKVISILGLILSPVSLYFARCIFVDITRLEPYNLSRSLLILSLMTGITLWLSLGVFVLFLIYCWTLLSPIISVPFKLWILIPWIAIRNNPFYLFWLRKTKDPHLEQKYQKIWNKSILLSSGKGIGAVSLLVSLVLVINYIQSMIKPYSLIHIAENIIVHADYRANDQISECTNLKQGEWGFLVGYNKISVAHPQESGGYTFMTKSCSFASNTLN